MTSSDFPQMSSSDFIQKYNLYVEMIADQLETEGVKVDKDFRGNTTTGGYSGKEKGFYIRLNYYGSLPKDAISSIKSIFPWTIDGFEFRLLGITDFDFDDDRHFLPSVGIAVYKNGESVINA